MKKIRLFKVISLVLILVCINCINVSANYNEYANARFGFSFKYPDKFSATNYSDNGDGVTMKYKKTKLIMYGSYNPSTFNVYTGKALKKQLKSYGYKMKNVKVKKRSLYYEKKNGSKVDICYSKISKKYGVEASFCITCSKKNLKKYRKIANKMIKSCKINEVYYYTP